MDSVLVDKPRRDCPRCTKLESTHPRLHNRWCIRGLAFDFRSLHARQAVEAFLDLVDCGGDFMRAPAPAGKGAMGGCPGRDGDMCGTSVALIVWDILF